MKKLYDYMHSVNIGNGSQGNWSISNHRESLNVLFDKLPSVKWNPQETELIYSNKNITRTANALGLTPDLVSEWMNDPLFAKFKDNVVKFSSLDSSETAIFNFLKNYFKLSVVRVFYQNLKSGEMTPWHLDGKKYKEYQLDEAEEYRVKRYIIFLEDQHPGQMWQINNDYIHWKAGDVLTWNQSTSPHGTANVGYHDRPVLMVTGVQSASN